MSSQLLEQTKRLLKINKIKSGYIAGQNFLICEDVLETIISTAAIKKTDNVLEIGPGLGALTSELVKRAAKVLAIEYDKQLIPLINKLVEVNDNLELINDDILNIKNKDIVAKLGEYRIIANIPRSEEHTSELQSH